jgi:hypothetical protein
VNRVSWYRMRSFMSVPAAARQLKYNWSSRGRNVHAATSLLAKRGNSGLD